jgi:hypothetical protein
MSDEKAKETSPVRNDLGQYVGTYTPEMGELICAEIIEGKSLRTICKMSGMPAKRTVMYWLNKHQDFKELYDRACIERAEGYAEELIDIADDGTNDYYTDSEGVEHVDHENIQRSRLRVDTRKWICAKMKPRKYGDKVAIGGAEDLPPIGTADMTEGEVARRIAFTLANGVKSAQEKPH